MHIHACLLKGRCKAVQVRDTAVAIAWKTRGAVGVGAAWSRSTIDRDVALLCCCCRADILYNVASEKDQYNGSKQSQVHLNAMGRSDPFTIIIVYFPVYARLLV